METLVTAAQLGDEYQSPDLVIFDASFYLPAEPQDAQTLFQQAHIPGAQFFDIDQISDHDSKLPHMLPDPSEFANAVMAFGVSNSSRIVVYDQRGLFSAARLWWMFKVFGHDTVTVLDGGLPQWQREHRPIETGPAQKRPHGHFTAGFRGELVRGLTEMQRNLDQRREIVLDARAAARFAGLAPEPRPGMRSGHYPNAISLPFTEILNEDGTMKPASALRASFDAAGVTATSSPVTMCGSGVTAAVLTLGLARAGLPLGALYDGSWTEWGGRANTAIEASS